MMNRYYPSSSISTPDPNEKVSTPTVDFSHMHALELRGLNQKLEKEIRSIEDARMNVFHQQLHRIIQTDQYKSIREYLGETGDGLVSVDTSLESLSELRPGLQTDRLESELVLVSDLEEIQKTYNQVEKLSIAGDYESRLRAARILNHRLSDVPREELGLYPLIDEMVRKGKSLVRLELDACIKCLESDFSQLNRESEILRLMVQLVPGSEWLDRVLCAREKWIRRQLSLLKDCIDTESCLRRISELREIFLDLIRWICPSHEQQVIDTHQKTIRELVIPEFIYKHLVGDLEEFGCCCDLYLRLLSRVTQPSYHEVLSRAMETTIRKILSDQSDSVERIQSLASACADLLILQPVEELVYLFQRSLTRCTQDVDLLDLFDSRAVPNLLRMVCVDQSDLDVL